MSIVLSFEISYGIFEKIQFFLDAIYIINVYGFFYGGHGLIMPVVAIQSGHDGGQREKRFSAKSRLPTTVTRFLSGA
jgi:hypothetical protein